jgi:hypothetical protein
VGIKLAFMGSATFALPSLNRLFELGYEITGVITQPDKPAGRGQTVQAPPVKKRAFELHLPIYQPRSVKTDEAHALVEALELGKGNGLHAIEINRLENEADRVHQLAVGRLFEEESNPIVVLKWKETLDFLEDATDCCEDVANVIEGVMVTHG